MSAQTKTFCVIEDNDVIRRLFVLLLEKDSDNRVYEFGDGETALAWLEDNRPDIVLCDIMLPGVGGTELLQAIRSLSYGPTVRVIALTAFARQGDREKYLALGFDGYMSKPVEPQTFLTDVYAMAQ